MAGLRPDDVGDWIDWFVDLWRRYQVWRLLGYAAGAIAFLIAACWTILYVLLPIVMGGNS